jgi:MFS family permease
MTRTGKYKIMSIIAAVLMTVGIYLLTLLNANSTYPQVIRDMIVMGFGIGALLPVLNVAVQNAFPYKVMGIVNAAQQFVRSLGAVIATPILGTVLANTFDAQMQLNLPPALKQAFAALPAAEQQLLKDPQTLTNAASQEAIRSQFQQFGAAGQQLYDQFINAVHQSLAAGTSRLFLIAFFFALGALIATFFLPEISLQHDEFYNQQNPSSRGEEDVDK